MQTRSRCLMCVLGLSLFVLTAELKAEEPSQGWIDVHMHLHAGSSAGQPQRQGPAMGPGSGMRPGQARQAPNFMPAAQALILQMDALGIEKSVIMPPPSTKGQRGSYGYESFLNAVRAYPDRIAFAAGGDKLNPMIMAIPASQVIPPMRRRFRETALQMLNDGASAFGEMTALHFSFSPKHPFEQAEADHPLLLLLADIAAEHGVPIDLHMEAVPEDQSVPPLLAKRSPNNPATIKATIPAFERLLRHNREANIVWQHVGWDNTGHMTPALVRRLLQDHPNLYCALKFVRKNYEPFQLGPGLMDENLKVRPEWTEVMSEFPDRFMIGADDFIHAGERRQAGPPSFEDTWALLDQLPEGLKEKIGRTNAARVYSLG